MNQFQATKCHLPAGSCAYWISSLRSQPASPHSGTTALPPAALELVARGWPCLLAPPKCGLQAPQGGKGLRCGPRLILPRPSGAPWFRPTKRPADPWSPNAPSRADLAKPPTTSATAPSSTAARSGPEWGRMAFKAAVAATGVINTGSSSLATSRGTSSGTGLVSPRAPWEPERRRHGERYGLSKAQLLGRRCQRTFAPARGAC